MNRLVSRKPTIIAFLSVSVNLVLIGYCLYLQNALKRLDHLQALGHANIQMAVLGALEAGRTNAAVELLEVQLRGEKVAIESDPQLTPQTPTVLNKLRAYRWKFPETAAVSSK
jgi:hypothetical protein